jgi:broad-specificity NMP kinase
MKKLLITGVPGTSKTTIGDYLAEKHGFTHINLEDPNGFPCALSGDKDSLEALLKDTDTDVVVT